MSKFQRQNEGRGYGIYTTTNDKKKIEQERLNQERLDQERLNQERITQDAMRDEGLSAEQRIGQEANMETLDSIIRNREPFVRDPGHSSYMPYVRSMQERHRLELGGRKRRRKTRQIKRKSNRRRTKRRSHKSSRR